MNNSGWLAQHLRDCGYANDDGIGRSARTGRCEQCRAEVVRGLDGDRCAMAAVADPHEIDALGEYLALRIGLITYSLRNSYSPKGKQIWVIDPRFQWEIAAGDQRPVLAQHRCGLQIPPAKQSRIPEPRRIAPLPLDGSPPF